MKSIHHECKTSEPISSISHFSGVVPQNSRNHLKRKEGGGSLHVLEDVHKTQSKIDISNSRQIENHRTLVRPILHLLQLSNHAFDGPARDSSISISKAISSDLSASGKAIAEIISKLPRFLK